MTVPTNEIQGVTNQQVFNPVPTNEDMQALNDRLDTVRRGRAQLLVTVIFLAGVVAAGLIGGVLFYGGMNERVASLEDDLTRKDAVIAGKNAMLAEQHAKLAEQSETIEGYADFQTIKALQSQADALEAEITVLLSQPSRANAPLSLKTFPDQIEWRDDVVNALRARRDALKEQKDAVAAWPPPVASPRPD